jgi:hypothetical protein
VCIVGGGGAEIIYDDDLLCDLMTSWMTTGIQMGEISKLGWLIGLLKHATQMFSLRPAYNSNPHSFYFYKSLVLPKYIFCVLAI